MEKTSHPSWSRVGDLLEATLKNCHLEEHFKVYPIAKKWAEIVGATLATKTQPDFVQGKTLHVSVINPVWMNELNLQKQGILEKMSQMGLQGEIEEIRLRLKKD